MIRSVIFALVFVTASSMSALGGTIVAGWHDSWNTSAATAVNDATGAFAENGTVSWQPEGRGASASGTFGSLLSGASTAAGDSFPADHPNAMRSNNNNATSIDFTITDTSGVARELEYFHFDLGRRSDPGTYQLEVLTGSSITVGNVGSAGTVPSFLGHATPEHDVLLTGLTDNILDANGTVTFRLNLTATSTNTRHWEIDNVALSSVPEPCSAVLFGLGGFALLLRRRK